MNAGNQSQSQTNWDVGNGAQPRAESGLLKSKFVGRSREANVTGELAKRAIFIPPEIRRAAQILGMDINDISSESVQQAWRREICAPGVHPDLGGHNETAILLNESKEQIMNWLQAAKLGKQFNTGAR